jgi:uncharacterized membrane protein YjjB (DUF3815 family)
MFPTAKFFEHLPWLCTALAMYFLIFKIKNKAVLYCVGATAIGWLYGYIFGTDVGRGL